MDNKEKYHQDIDEFIYLLPIAIKSLSELLNSKKESVKLAAAKEVLRNLRLLIDKDLKDKGSFFKTW